MKTPRPLTSMGTIEIDYDGNESLADALHEIADYLASDPFVTLLAITLNYGDLPEHTYITALFDSFGDDTA